MSDANEEPVEDKPRRPSLISTLCAPILCVASATRATSLLIRASAFQLAFVLLLYMSLEAALCVGLAVWGNTVRYDYRNLTTQSAMSGAWSVESHSMAEVWAEWSNRRRGNPAVEIFTGVGFATLAAVVIAIALFWPRVYRHGRLRPALRRTLAAVLASSGLAIVLTAIVFATTVQIRHWRMWHGLRWGSGLQPEHFATVATLSSILLMIHAIGRAARAASDVNFAPDPTPRCEGCGYDLTHRPDSGLCPECGISVNRSLEPGRGRRPADFDKATSLPDAMATSIEALFSPATFYRSVTVRIEPQRDALFRVRHHTAIFVGAMIWITILMVSSEHGSWGFDESTALLAGAMGATLAGWTVQHVVGGIVCLVWAVKRTLPDLRWGVRVVNFETVYLWFLCVFNGMMITSFVIFEDWIGAMIGSFNRVTGLPSAIIAVLLPNLAMIGYWFVRLLRNGRAVQWANF